MHRKSVTTTGLLRLCSVLANTQRCPISLKTSAPEPWIRPAAELGLARPQQPASDHLNLHAGAHPRQYTSWEGQAGNGHCEVTLQQPAGSSAAASAAGHGG